MVKRESIVAPGAKIGLLAVLLAVLPAAAATGPAAQAETSSAVTVTYLANEGFLISAGDKSVLVDALFPGIRHYSRVTGRALADLTAARPPFDGVDLVLASHYHDDHFGPRETSAFLAASPATVLISTPQALERFEESGALDSSLLSRVHESYPAEGESEVLKVSGISVEILNLHHGRSRRPQVENLGFVIDLGGFRILHVGDTEVSLADLAPYDLASRGIDLALLPGWFLTEPDWIAVTHAIRPRALAAMHLAEPSAPPSWFGSASSLAGRKRMIRGAFPEVWIPDSALDSRTYRILPGRP